MIPIEVFSQIDSIEIEWGLKGGINFSTLVGEEALPQSKPKIGYSLGFYAATKISGSYYFQPEFIWSLQGQDSEESGKYDISYLNVPLMFKWKYRFIYIELGPQLGFITINSSEDVPPDLRLDDFNTFELAINSGIGFQLGKDWSAGVRYSRALTNLVPGIDARGSVWYIGIGYRVF
jgi:hypothetical protein